MVQVWCPVCSTTHADGMRCPGELIADTPARHGWRISVTTDHGIEAYGVLVARTTHGLWCARILTYPNVIWATPGGRSAMKFVARSPHDVERQAVEYIRDHCRERGHRLNKAESLQTPEKIKATGAGRSIVVPATRVIRFLPVP